VPSPRQANLVLINLKDIPMSIITFDHPLAPLPAKKRIALVAHDAKKSEMCEWVKKHRSIFAQHELYATGTTGRLIENETNLPVKK